jgi:hypothetical protein
MITIKNGVKIVFEWSVLMQLWVLECFGSGINTCQTFACYTQAEKEHRDTIATYHS